MHFIAQRYQRFICLIFSEPKVKEPKVKAPDGPPVGSPDWPPVRSPDGPPFGLSDHCHCRFECHFVDLPLKYIIL